MIVRVRTNMGVWRVQVTDTTATVSDVLREIQKSRPHVVYETSLCIDPACQQPLDVAQTLRTQNISHGGMVHCRVDPSSTVDITAVSSSSTATDTTQLEPHEDGAASTEITTTTKTAATNSNMRRVIDKDGTIKLVPSNEANPTLSDKGFRKGMLALRDMKMHWTRTYQNNDNNGSVGKVVIHQRGSSK